MLVPNPSQDFRAMVGGVDADNLSDISDLSDTILENLNSFFSLYEQLKDSFAVDQSPTWMDSSTNFYCQRMNQVLGGPEVST